MMNEKKSKIRKENILYIEAEGISDGYGGCSYITTNKETGIKKICNNLKEIADFVKVSARSTKKEYMHLHVRFRCTFS